jgi:spectinomycin phosphotransferase
MTGTGLAGRRRRTTPGGHAAGVDHHEFVQRVAAATPERLRAWVREDFGLDLARLEPVGLGGDATAALWHGTSLGGPGFAVKLSGSDSGAGLLVQAHLVAQGVPGVLMPLVGSNGRPWARRHGLRLSVLPWIDGSRGVQSGLTPPQWTDFGRLLARVHAVPIDGRLRDVVAPHTHRHDALAAHVRSMQARLSTGRATGAPTPADDALEDPLVAGLEQRWLEAQATVPALLDGADRLSRRLRAQPPPSVLCHGDPHVGNVLVDAAGRVWLIDWDDAVLAPVDHDLMFVLGGVLADAPVTAEQQAWFAAGYGPLDVDAESLAYHRCTRALLDLVDPAEQVLDAERYPEAERDRALHIVAGVLSGTGLARQALASLEELGLTDSSSAPAAPPSACGTAREARARARRAR